MMTPAEARQELLTKTLSQIHEATAETWAIRAVAARQLFAETGDMRWAVTFTDARHEALEHGALSENPDFLAGIQATLQRS